MSPLHSHVQREDRDRVCDRVLQLAAEDARVVSFATLRRAGAGAVVGSRHIVASEL
jgi:hypothetical protein